MRTRLEIETEFAPREALNSVKEPFLVGIGGEGMRPLALLWHEAGVEISGSDAGSPPAELTELGIKVSNHTGELPEGTDALVLSDAIDLKTSPEVATARAKGLPLFRRSQLLGHLISKHKVLAVTGTHGKTTTTALLASGMIGAGLDPLVIVGARVPEFGGSLARGKGEWAVIEACEAYDALRDIDPYAVVLTNLELDHADFHGNYEGLKTAVLSFVDRLPTEGKLFFCVEDKGAKEIAFLTSRSTQAYDFEDGLEGLTLPGRHNLLNSAGAKAALEFALGSTAPESAIEAMRNLGGAERRLQSIGEVNSVTVVDDYAHHPTEIEASIQALREKFPSRRLRIVYQPHLYSRTQEFMDGFGAALSHADEVWLTDIYPAREAPIPGVSSAVLAERIQAPVRYVPQRHLLPKRVAAEAEPGDVIVGMGAGTIGAFPKALIEALTSRFDLESGARKLKLAVLYGGDSSEREISLLSGAQMASALTGLGAEVRLIDVSENLLGSDGSAFRGFKPDLAVLAVHGTHAEDGAIQGLLELVGVPYTGSGILASALAMDKARAKRELEAGGLRVPKGVLVKDASAPIGLGLPLVVKPNAEGSTVGVGFVRQQSELCPALQKALSYGDALVEELIEGTEISVPVLLGKALTPVEIVPASGVYDFASKYTSGATQEICPARLPEAVLARAKEYAVAAHEIMGCQGATRTDMIVLPGGELVILEINTLPGMTRTSLLPTSAASQGIEFPELCRLIVADGLNRAQIHAPGWGLA